MEDFIFEPEPNRHGRGRVLTPREPRRPLRRRKARRLPGHRCTALRSPRPRPRCGAGPGNAAARTDLSVRVSPCPARAGRSRSTQGYAREAGPAPLVGSGVAPGCDGGRRRARCWDRSVADPAVSAREALRVRSFVPPSSVKRQEPYRTTASDCDARTRRAEVSAGGSVRRLLAHNRRGDGSVRLAASAPRPTVVSAG